jgi:hypothetical protein
MIAAAEGFVCYHSQSLGGCIRIFGGKFSSELERTLLDYSAPLRREVTDAFGCSILLRLRRAVVGFRVSTHTAIRRELELPLIHRSSAFRSLGNTKGVNVGLCCVQP